MKRFLTAILLVAATGSGQADPWEPVARENNVEFLIDRGSIRRSGDYVVFDSLGRVQPPPGEAAGFAEPRAMRMRFVADCVHEGLHTASIHYLDAAGKTVQELVLSRQPWPSINRRESRFATRAEDGLGPFGLAAVQHVCRLGGAVGGGGR